MRGKTVDPISWTRGISMSILTMQPSRRPLPPAAPHTTRLGRAAECESEWSMDWATRRNARHIGGRGGFLCTSKSVRMVSLSFSVTFSGRTVSAARPMQGLLLALTAQTKM